MVFSSGEYLFCVILFSIADITFIHEGNKTFHDNLVNFEKLVSVLIIRVDLFVGTIHNHLLSFGASLCLLVTFLLSSLQHMIADTVRLIRHCQTDQTGGCLFPPHLDPLPLLSPSLAPPFLLVAIRHMVLLWKQPGPSNRNASQLHSCHGGWGGGGGVTGYCTRSHLSQIFVCKKL